MTLNQYHLWLGYTLYYLIVWMLFMFIGGYLLYISIKARDVHHSVGWHVFARYLKSRWTLRYADRWDIAYLEFFGHFPWEQINGDRRTQIVVNINRSSSGESSCRVHKRS